MSSQAAELHSIFLSERGRLRRLIHRIVGDSAAADDLLHETFLKVANAMAHTVVGDYRGYFVRAATNVALDYRRRLRVAAPAADSENELMAIADRSPSPESAVAGRQAAAVAVAALARLPERTRRAFEMHRIEERTMTEIARELGISVALVHKLITDALTAVRNELRAGGFLTPPRN